MAESPRSLPQQESAGVRRCLECFYILDGLAEPRCPECGRTFSFNDATTYTTRSLRSLRSRLWLIGKVAVVLGLTTALGVLGLRAYQRYQEMGVYLAAENGDWASVVRRIKVGGNVHYCDPHSGVTALHLASEHGQTDIVKLLLGAGARPDAWTFMGETPLHMAVAGGHVEVVRLLSKVTMSVDALDTWGPRPLHLAIQNGDVAILQILINAGSRLTDNQSLPPLHLAAAKGNVAMVEFLLACGADPVERTDAGHWRLAALEWLTPEQNLVVDSGTMSALDIAAERGHIAVMQKLIAAQTQRSGGATAAAQRMVFEHPYAAAFGQALTMGRWKWGGGPASVPLVTELPAAPIGGAIHWAAAGGCIKSIRFLLDRQPLSVNLRSRSGGTPLHWAAYFGRPEAVDYLLAFGADIEARGVMLVAREREGRWLGVEGTPLHAAAYMGHAAVVKQLLDAGADPGATNSSGQTPLDLARAEGHEKVARLLGRSTSRPADSQPSEQRSVVRGGGEGVR